MPKFPKWKHDFFNDRSVKILLLSALATVFFHQDAINNSLMAGCNAFITGCNKQVFSLKSFGADPSCRFREKHNKRTL